MAASLLDAVRGVSEHLSCFEPVAFSADDCAVLAEALARTAKACVAASARAAARAAEAGAHHRRGYASPADWLADHAGSTVGQAREVLGATSALEDCPRTK